MRVGIPDFSLFSLSVPPDARTRGPDPLEPFPGPLEPFLGLLELPPWPLDLPLAFCCLGAYFSRRPESAGLGASLSGRPDTGRLTQWAPRLVFERQQE